MARYNQSSQENRDNDRLFHRPRNDRNQAGYDLDDDYFSGNTNRNVGMGPRGNNYSSGMYGGSNDEYGSRSSYGDDYGNRGRYELDKDIANIRNGYGGQVRQSRYGQGSYGQSGRGGYSRQSSQDPYHQDGYSQDAQNEYGSDDDNEEEDSMEAGPYRYSYNHRSGDYNERSNRSLSTKKRTNNFDIEN